MAKYKKDEVVAALEPTIAKETEEFQRMADKAPEKQAQYDADLKEWAGSLKEWKKEAIEKFTADVNGVTTASLEKGYGYAYNRFGNYRPPLPPQKPAEIQAKLAGKSAHCSRAERSLVRVKLMLEDKNGGIVLHDTDEIFYQGLIPCR